MKDGLRRFYWPVLIGAAATCGLLVGHFWAAPRRFPVSVSESTTGIGNSLSDIIGAPCSRTDVASSTPLNQSIQCVFPSESATSGVWRLPETDLAQLPPLGSFPTLAPVHHFVSVHAPIEFSYPDGAQLTEVQPDDSAAGGPIPDDVIEVVSSGEYTTFEYYHDPQHVLDVSTIASSSLNWEARDSRPQATEQELRVANDPSSGTITVNVPSAAIEGQYEGMGVTWLLPITSGYLQIHTTLGANISADASIYPILESLHLDE